MEETKFKIGDKVTLMPKIYTAVYTGVYTVELCGQKSVRLKEIQTTDFLIDDVILYETASEVKKPTGIKHDQDKPDMSLLSNTALIKIAQVMSFGKRKYSAHNWRGGFIWSRPLAAAARHLYAYIGGEDKDPETGLSHLAHCACWVMFLLEFEETHPELDDRHKNDNKN